MALYVVDGYLRSGYVNAGIYVDWPNKLIFIPKEVTQLIQSVPTEIRTLDLDVFHQTLRDLEDDPLGMPWLKTHNYVGPVTVGGVQLAAVVEIINDYTITIEDGQYAVNLIGANSNVGDNINVNQVSVRSANSAGLTYSDEVNSQSFTDGAIWVDVAAGFAGFAFPQGTPRSPVNNWTDAKAVQDREKLERFNVNGTLVLTSADDLSGDKLVGTNPISDVLVLAGANTTLANVSGMTVTGTQAGRVYYEGGCVLSNITDFSGGVVDGLLTGTLTVDSTFTGQMTIAKSGSAVPGTDKPVLDMSTSTADVNVRDFSGSIHLKNFSQGADASFDFLSGNLYLDSTSTSGTVVVRGDARVIDNDTGDAIKSGTINGSLVVVNETTQEMVWGNTSALTVPKFLALK